MECSCPYWSTILARLFSGQTLQWNNAKPLAEHSEAHTHLNKPNNTMSHPKLPYRQATNVSLPVYHCSVIGFSAAYRRGAAPDDTIDRRPWQIIAYNVEGIPKFQPSLAAWFRLKIHRCWAGGKEKSRALEWCSNWAQGHTLSPRHISWKWPSHEKITARSGSSGMNFSLSVIPFSKSSIWSDLFVWVSLNLVSAVAQWDSLMCCIPEKIKN